MAFFIVTNNQKVQEAFGERVPVQWVAGGYVSVLKAARDAIHRGHVLLSHPLYGSIKPQETPFRSLLISQEVGDAVDLDSLLMIEEAIASVGKFEDKQAKAERDAKIKDDFAAIDLALVTSAVAAANGLA